MEAAALNPLDTTLAHGDTTGWFPLAFPYVPGTDFAGVVVSLGEDVTDLQLGDAVLGRSDPVAGGALAGAAAIAEAAARGVLRPEAPGVLSFEKSVAAYRDDVAGRRTGKLVMRPQGGGRSIDPSPRRGTRG